MNNSFLQKRKTFFQTFTPWIGSILLFPVAFYYTINAGKFTFIDFVNLLIHEGGHGIFKIFGGFVYTLGGSLMQIIIPSMFIIFYWVKQKRVMTQVFLIWLGENLINISVYASDARAKKLPLLGGNKVYHDWNWMLGKTGLLEYDYLIGQIFFGFGIIVFLFSFVAPLLIEKTKETTTSLPYLNL
jgi:hypothetical protein